MIILCESPLDIWVSILCYQGNFNLSFDLVLITSEQSLSKTMRVHQSLPSPKEAGSGFLRHREPGKSHSSVSEISFNWHSRSLTNCHPTVHWLPGLEKSSHGLHDSETIHVWNIQPGFLTHESLHIGSHRTSCQQP